jgi:hypothetical protein
LIKRKGNREKMGLQEEEPSGDGYRGRGTKGKWDKRKGNRGTEGRGSRERGTEIKWVQRKGNRGKMG